MMGPGEGLSGDEARRQLGELRLQLAPAATSAARILSQRAPHRSSFLSLMVCRRAAGYVDRILKGEKRWPTCRCRRRPNRCRTLDEKKDNNDAKDRG